MAALTVLHAAAIVVLAVVLAVVVASAGVLMSNDGPQHVLASMAAAAHGADGAFAHVTHATDGPTTHGFHEVFQLFVPAFGWQRAYTITLVIVAEAWAFGLLAFVWCFAPQRRVLGLLGFPTALSLSFYLGVLPFLFSMALGLLVLSAHLRVPSKLVRHVLVAAGLYLMARAHILPAALVGVTIVVDTCVSTSGAPRRRALLYVVVAAVPALTVVLMVAGDPVLAARKAAVWWPLGARLFDTFLPGPAWRGAAALALAVVGIAVALASGTRRERALAVLAAALCAAPWLVPRDVFGWELAAPRFSPLGHALAFALLPIERWPRARHVVTAAVVACCAAGLAWGAVYHARLRDACAPALALVHSDVADARLLSEVVLEVSCGLAPLAPNVTPLVHLASLYAVDRRTVGEFPQATSPRIHLIIADAARFAGLAFVDPSLWMALPADDAERAARVRSLARAYRGRPLLLLQGRGEDIDAWLQLGWVAEARGGSVFMGTFVGCAATVDPHVSAGPTLFIGAAGDDAPWRSLAPVESVIDGLPCGEVWLTPASTCASGRAGATLIAGVAGAFSCR